MTDKIDVAHSKEDSLLFTPEEWEYIGENSGPHPTDVIQNLSRKLSTVLHELGAAWHHLPEPVIEECFSQTGQSPTHAIRGPILSVMALAYYGGQLNGDDIAARMREAIRAAEAAQGNHAEVDLHIRTSAMLTPTETIEKLESGNDRSVSFAELEQLWYSPEVSAERIASCEATFQPSKQELQELRSATTHQPRPPTATVLNAEPEHEHD